jgi:hypothetical protein
MASEEERAAILAEYKAASAAGYSDEDDEADFDPGDDDSDDESNASDEEDDHAILHGSLSLNEDGRLIYSGSWSMKSDPNKRSKFKLRSQQVFHSKKQLEGCPQDKEGDGPKKASPVLFDEYNPTKTQLDSSSNGSTPLPSRRTILFDGFFFVKSDEHKEAVASNNGERKSKHGEKVKERDVEIFIQQESDSSGYSVTGRGYNTYGPFVLEGKYTVPAYNGGQAEMELQKTYGSGGNTKDTNVARGSKRRHVESDDDDDEEYEERTGFSELIELTEDAHLSVEELRKKYYGGDVEEEEDGDGGGGKMPAKMAKLEESDDSDCGF